MKEKNSIRSAWTGLALCLALAGLMPRAACAEDIDIYQGAAGSGAPNLLILYDNAAASDASASYTCDATIPGGTTKLSEDKKTTEPISASSVAACTRRSVQSVPIPL